MKQSERLNYCVERLQDVQKMFDSAPFFEGDVELTQFIIYVRSFYEHYKRLFGGSSNV